MAEKAPFVSLETLYLFPRIATRELYRANYGMEAPAYVLAKPLKYWIDPNPVEAPFTMNGVPVAVYTTFNGKFDAVGNAIMEQFIVSVEDAKTVNIPPSNLPSPPGANNSIVPFPFKLPSPTQKIVMHLFSPAVQNLDVSVDTGAPAGSTTLDAIYGLLQKIAKAMSIS